MGVEHISAVTFAVREMRRAVLFYQKLGFDLDYGGENATFTSLRSGNAYVNLIVAADHRPAWWGRVIFRVDDADAQHRRMAAAGLQPDPPRDAQWGERYFHITDPDGHELSFAQLLKATEAR